MICGDWSTITTLAAAREAASKPSAPLPANKSRQDLPLRSCPSQLNSVSRTQFGVGRRPDASGKDRIRRRHSPPMMRSEFSALFPCHHDGHQMLCRNMPRERRLDVGNRHPINVVRVVI